MFAHFCYLVQTFNRINIVKRWKAAAWFLFCWCLYPSLLVCCILLSAGFPLWGGSRSPLCLRKDLTCQILDMALKEKKSNIWTGRWKIRIWFHLPREPPTTFQSDLYAHINANRYIDISLISTRILHSQQLNRGGSRLVHLKLYKTS